VFILEMPYVIPYVILFLTAVVLIVITLKRGKTWGKRYGIPILLLSTAFFVTASMVLPESAGGTHEELRLIVIEQSKQLVLFRQGFVILVLLVFGWMWVQGEQGKDK